MRFGTLAHHFCLFAGTRDATGPLALALSRFECSRPRCPDAMRLGRFEAVAIWAAPRSLLSARLEGFPEWHGMEAQPSSHQPSSATQGLGKGLGTFIHGGTLLILGSHPVTRCGWKTPGHHMATELCTMTFLKSAEPPLGTKPDRQDG